MFAMVGESLYLTSSLSRSHFALDDLVIDVVLYTLLDANPDCGNTNLVCRNISKPRRTALEINVLVPRPSKKQMI